MTINSDLPPVAATVNSYRESMDAIAWSRRRDMALFGALVALVVVGAVACAGWILLVAV